MVARRALGVLVLGLGTIWGCAGTEGAKGSEPEALPIDQVAPQGVIDTNRSRARGPRTYAFEASGKGFVAQQERDVTVFVNGTMKVQDLDTGEEVELGTEYIGRDRNLWVGPATEALDDDGAVVITRAGLVELYRPYRRATMQAWSFETVPSGKGDLTVRVRLPNVTRVDAEGDNLKVQTATAAFLYEQAAWIDADNNRTKIVPKWNGSAIEITVPEELVANSKYPAMIDPLVGPYPATKPPTPAYAPAVASNGSSYMVVWEDYSNTSNAPRILGRTYTAGGAPNVGPFLVTGGAATGTFIEGEPTISFDGTNYVVAWWDNNNAQSRNRVRARAVSTAGVPQGTAVTLASGNGDRSEFSPSIACKAGHCGIAYTVVRNGSGFIRFASFIGPSTTRAPIRLSPTGNAVAPSVATDGTNFFIVWEQGAVGTANVRGVRVVAGASTNTVGTVGILAAAGAGEAYGPSTSYSGIGTNYVVAFSRYTAANSDDVMGLIATVGGGAPSASAEATVKGGAGDQDNVALDCKNGSCLAAVWDSSNIVGVSVSPITAVGNIVTQLSSVSATGYRENAKVAASNAGFFSAWSDKRGTYYQVWGALAGGSEQLVSKP